MLKYPRPPAYIAALQASVHIPRLPEVLNRLPEMLTVWTLYRPVKPATLVFVHVTTDAVSTSNPPLMVPPITVKLAPFDTYTFPFTVVDVRRQTPLTGTRTSPGGGDVMD